MIKGSQASLDADAQSQNALKVKDPKPENPAQASTSKLEKKVSMESSLKTSITGSVVHAKEVFNNKSTEKEKKVSVNET